MSSRINVGDQYENFESLQKEVTLYENETYVNLRKSDSQLIKTAKARNMCMDHKDDLIYKHVVYICKHGGSYRSNKTTGERPKQMTNKKNCPFKMKFAATKNGQALECVKIISEHNHESSQEEFKFDHTQRELDSMSKSEIADILKLNPNRKLVKKHFEEKTGKTILLKDIHNIGTKTLSMDSKKNKDASELDKWLKNPYPSLETSYLVEENVMTGFFFAG